MEELKIYFAISGFISLFLGLFQFYINKQIRNNKEWIDDTRGWISKNERNCKEYRDKYDEKLDNKK
jgi:hypothetical protein